MMTESKLMSECGTKLVLDDNPAEKYQIEIEPGDYLVIEVGGKVGKPVANFKHPNIALSVPKIYEFKHYRHGGGKFYTSAAGISHYLVIPRNKITLLPEKGYSYVKAVINGVKVSFNVTGIGSGGWTDVVHTQTQISVNHPLRDVKKLAEVAVRGTAMEPIVTEQFDAGDKAHWELLAAKANPNVKATIYGLVEKGLNPVVKLLSGYVFEGKSEGKGIELVRGYKWHDLGEGRKSYQQDGRVKSIVMTVDGYRVRAKVDQIDWAATVKANGIAA